MENRVILVTGGTKGIGKAICLKFAQMGFSVATFGRDINAINALKSSLSEIGKPFIVDKCDATKRKDIQRFFETCVQTFSHIDVLVNNVGVFIPGKIQEEDDDTFTLMMETNLNATYYFSKLSIPYLKKSHKACMFNICSTASIKPYNNGGTYCISKYAQYGLTKVLREELKEDNISVTAVLPGATLTDSWAGTDLPSSRFLKPESIAEMIAAGYNLPKGTVMEDIILRPMEGDIE